MPYVQWPPLPAYSAVIASDDVYLNVTTPLTVIGGGGGSTAPGNVPAPVAGTITSTSIEISFDVAGVTGTQPISYNAGYATSPGGIYQFMLLSGPVGTVYSGTAAGLTPNTPYYFRVSAVNAVGQTNSTVTPISTATGAPTAPGAPSPSLANNGGLISTLYFDTAGVTGTPPITYDLLWSLSGPPFISTTANLSSGTIYTAVINDLPTTYVDYEIYARASNAEGATISDNTIITGSTIAGPVTVTPSTMTLGTDGAGVSFISLSTFTINNGNPVAEIVAQFGTVSSSLISTTGTFDVASYNPNAVSTIFDLPSSTTFYFNSKAFNIFGSTINTTITVFSTLSS
jgi:hypothetical protein